MIILRYLSIILSIVLLSSPSFAKETKYTCKPKSAAAVRSNGIQVFKITGEEKPVEITIQDGEGLKSGYFLVNRSKYEILDLGTGKAYAFDKNEPWTHIQDIFFLDNNVLSFILAANASITRYLCNQLK
ncbi:MAG: hypothetical protein ISQ39_06560 [Alphaproteobacteria bacterium]|nr:hypothetical protein [Alphaproteobacteria bacterium]